MYIGKKENIVKLTDEIIKAADVFSQKVAPTTREKHLERGHKDDGGVISTSNHFKGTLAEFGVYLWANFIGGECTKPDTVIYPAHKKSYKKDLVWETPDGIKRNLHVKSQTPWSAERYGFSWVFTKTDRINQMTGPNDYVVLTYVHDNSTIEILKIVQGAKLVQFFKDPVEAQYKDSKRAIYYEDFAHLDLL
jgi:hypothetical protein